MIGLAIAFSLLQATASTPSADSPVSWGNPVIKRYPNEKQMMRAYPRAAERAGVRRGVATIQCRALASGKLHGCFVVEENPSGYGFGRAALSLSSKIRMEERTLQGGPIEGRELRYPFTWK